MRRKNKKMKIIAFLFSIILIGIGYAYLTANLKITGTTKIGNARFDVHFENAAFEGATSNVTYPSNSNSNLARGIPIIKGENNTELEWNVILNQPGDYYVISADIVNSGDIDAELDLENSSLKIKIGDEEESTIGLNDISAYNFFGYEEDSLITYFGGRFDRDIQYINSGDTKEFAMEVVIDEETITNEQWEAIKGKNINITIDLKYIQGVNNPPSISNSNSNSNNNNNEPFNVVIDNPTILSLSDTASLPTNVNGPKITNTTVDSETTDHVLEFEVVLNEPGDTYEFTVDIDNLGGYNAALNTSYYYTTYQIGDGEEIRINSWANDFPSYLDHDVTELSGGWSSLFIYSGDSAQLKIHLELKEDATPEEVALIQGKTIKMKQHFRYFREDVRPTF